jgi:DNA invertase Pin-like site-specific DNA recombinase
MQKQVQTLQDLAKRLNLDVIKVFEEYGSVDGEERLVFLRVLNGLRRGEAQGLICMDFDRLCRNFLMKQVLIGVFQDLNIEVITHDSVTSFDKSVRQCDDVEAMFHQCLSKLEAKNLSERIKRGIRLKKARS